MAKIEITWAVTNQLSIVDEARALGFDLRKFEQQRSEIKVAMKKETIDRIVSQVRSALLNYCETESSLTTFNTIRNGVYVISIGGGFGVKYKNGCSEIMYIGRGSIANRIRSHLHQWIFDMSLSLRDVPFKFIWKQLEMGALRLHSKILNIIF